MINRAVAQIVSIIVLAVLSIACSRIPDNVLSPDKMADLLVDIYKGESVIDLERSRYYSDSMKLLVKQSVYHAHNVDEATVDTSYVWYGHHIDEYLKVYDIVIDRLEGQLADATGTHIVYGEGDSINIWPGNQRYRLTSGAINNISYRIPVDDSHQRGDNYQISFKVLTPNETHLSLYTIIMAQYDDGGTEFKYAYSTNDDNVKVRFVADSTRNITDMTATITYDIAPGSSLWLDSLSLVKTRVQPSTYTMRYGQRALTPRHAGNDSISVSE